MASLLTLDEAQALVLERTKRLPPELVTTAEASGRVIAEPVRARVDLPPFPSSAMDGFAVRVEDLPGPLRVVGESAAGSPFAGEVDAGQAVGISTGAVVPEGADAVIPVEYVVNLDDNSIRAEADLAQGAHVRPRGGDVAVGDVVASAGTRLAPALLAAVAAAGVAEVPCARRPRIAVLATGSELVAPGAPLGPGQIYETNTLMLAAALAAEGLVATEPPARDDEPALRSALERALAADVVVTSGGVSMGEHDLVRAVELELGVEEVFWRVAIKPGKPVSFGVLGGTLVFGLPGNPVSALVGCELFVKPALRALQGMADPLPRFEPGRAAVALRRNAERDEFLRARSRVEDGVVVLEPVLGQESHMIVRAGGANALVHVPRGNGSFEAGALVSWLRIGAEA